LLPVSRAECDALGWDELDVIIVTGDAYVDHPAFGAALIGRALVAAGFRTGVIAQPDWHSDAAFMALGRPRLFFGVTAGNLDSLVNHYTAQRKVRSDDAYAPGGRAGLRPDRATIVYAQCLRRCFKGVPVVAGGIEASLRRVPHYDFWSDAVRNSLLFDAKADIIAYGMAERAVADVARRMARGIAVKEIVDLPGTVASVKAADAPHSVMLPAFEHLRTPQGFFEYDHLVRRHSPTHTLFMPHAGRFLRHNPPAPPLQPDELDAVYGLPFARQPHPVYRGAIIPAFEQIKDSITAHRGCFGGCSFCALAAHQGKTIQSRSQASIVEEARRMAGAPGFSGMISDVGGPTANMYGMRCARGISTRCPPTSCLFPARCPHLVCDHRAQLRMLEAVRGVRGVKKVFIASGVRFDLALHDDAYIHALAEHYTGGHLKVAPEHTQPGPLRLMHKPPVNVYHEFVQRFLQHSTRAHKRHQIIPYLLVGHPGTTLNDAIELGRYVKQRGLRLEQVQEFTPTPMTASTCMYFTGRDDETGAPIHVPKGRELKLHKALVQWWKPENKKYIVEALRQAGKTELLDEFLQGPRRDKGSVTSR